MTCSTIAAIALGWMLINTWVTLAMLRTNDACVNSWRDMLWLLLSSVISPILVYVGAFVKWQIDDYILFHGNKKTQRNHKKRGRRK